MISWFIFIVSFLQIILSIVGRAMVENRERSRSPRRLAMGNQAEKEKSEPNKGDALPAASSSSSTTPAAPVLSQRDKDMAHLATFSWFNNIDLDGKPSKYAKRMMGELRKMFPSDNDDDGCSFEIMKMDLSQFHFTLRTESINNESELYKDLKKHKLEGVKLEMNIPEEFPTQPPQIRVLYPQISGGFVFKHGAICFEPLTPGGWVPVMALPNLAQAVKGIMDYNPVKVAGLGDAVNKTIPQYTEADARKEYAHIVKVHEKQGWTKKVKDLKS